MNTFKSFIALIILNLVKAKPLPEVQVDGYQELEEPFYPFQQYIQVRKSYTVEHVPVYEKTSPSNLQASASGDGRDQTSASNYEGYHAPRLREEISDYKKHEVYEEKGYGDSAYDHSGYQDRGRYEDNEPEYEASSYPKSSSMIPSGYHKYKQRRPTNSLHTPDGSSTKLLEYAASLHDHPAQARGIYASRDHIYCPEVIDFDLSSKSMKMGEGGRGAKPRLSGLGSKIKCLKEKYFGREPLPQPIFQSETIEIPTFQNFFKMIRDHVDSSSSFQHAK